MHCFCSNPFSFKCALKVGEEAQTFCSNSWLGWVLHEGRRLDPGKLQGGGHSITKIPLHSLPCTGLRVPENNILSQPGLMYFSITSQPIQLRIFTPGLPSWSQRKEKWVLLFARPLFDILITSLIKATLFPELWPLCQTPHRAFYLQPPWKVK